MKKILLLLVCLITVFSLASCDTESTPDGMQLCWGGSDVGYNFYVPDGWVLSNTGNIHASYASRIDISSVSFAEVKISEPEILPEQMGAYSPDLYFFEFYFKEQLKEFPSAPEITVNGENTVFGKKDYTAERAIKYIFNHEYDNHKFTTMQILLKANSKYYIFTYTSMNEERSEGETYYAFHLTEVRKCIDEFMFLENAATEKAEIEYEKDGDGFLLYSDKSLSGFELYVSPDFSLDYQSAIVSATHADGSNITMTKVTAAGVAVNEYWERRQTELSAIVSDITVIAENEPCEFGNAQKMFSYEYTFKYNGKTFHVYQVLAVYGMNGYVFTYTATEANYLTHIDKINDSCDKVILK